MHPGREPLRRRSLRVLVASVALGSTGHIAASTVSTIAAEHIGGEAALAGAPGAGVVLGAAAGATLLSALMARRGRRIGLAAGYGIGVLGALVATAAVVAMSLPLLLGAMVLIGFGNSANQLSRYTAADLFPPSRRASAIGTVVWASTVGAVVGPNLAPVAGRLATAAGLPELAGPYLVPIVFVGAAGLLSFTLLRPDPFELADEEAVRTPVGADPGTVDRIRVASLLARPAVAAAIVALVAGQFVMVLIMTMTPLHMTAHGHHLDAVGLVLSAHTFGMFALSPLSGRLTDRFGAVPVIFLGSTVLAVSALLSAVAPPSGGTLLGVALFLLGWGWNLGFVAGSTLLANGVSHAERTRLQGAADSLIWGTAALASLGSGVLVATAGFASLGLLGAAIVLVPIWVVATRRRGLAAQGMGDRTAGEPA